MLQHLKKRKERNVGKGVKHYFRDGKLHKGATHKMPNGKLHSGKTHTKTSKRIFHYGELSKKAQATARKQRGK